MTMMMMTPAEKVEEGGWFPGAENKMHAKLSLAVKEFAAIWSESATLEQKRIFDGATALNCNLQHEPRCFFYKKNREIATICCEWNQVPSA